MRGVRVRVCDFFLRFEEKPLPIPLSRSYSHVSALSLRICPPPMLGSTFKFVSLAGAVGLGLATLQGLSVRLDNVRQATRERAAFERAVATEQARYEEPDCFFSD